MEATTRKRLKSDEPVPLAEKEEADELREAEKPENIIKAELEVVEPKIDQNVTDEIDNLFKFAISRHRRRAKPDPRKFIVSEKYKMTEYQEEGLGWMLDREGFVAEPEEISPSKAYWVADITTK